MTDTMTNREAIDILRVVNPPRESKRIFDDFIQARDMAIKALENQERETQEKPFPFIVGQPPDAHYPSWYAAQIEDIPAADVAPAVHSRWIKTEDGAECEKCGREAVYQIIDDHWQYEPFCPYCGAKMDGGNEA